MSDRERGPLDFDPDEEAAPAVRGRPRPKGLASEGPSPEGGGRSRTSRYGWVVGVAFLAWIAYITLNTLSTDSPGSRGLPDDRPLPPFAAPLALSDLDGDANVARGRDQGAAGRRPACDVRGARILNSCELAERGPVVIAFYAGRAGEACRRQLDGLERVRASFPGVQFAAVAIRGDRADLRGLIREAGWRYPVGYDRDGQVANLYRVAGCPTTTFAYPGGIVMHTYLGLLGDGRLRAAVRRLVAGSERRGWSPPRA